jgi:phospholipid/cholesterol/gamma-HCH transport system ATP-binding protein
MIDIRNLRKSFNEQEVLKGVNLSIPKGRITAIIGRSGTGKSVLLKHIIGILKPDSGEMLIDGKNIAGLNGRGLNEVRKKFGMLFQGAALFDSMDVYENVAFPLREKTQMPETEIRSRVERELTNVGIVGMNNKYPAQLSGGMKKRVGLARALIMDPEIVLFDEPTTGLDPIMKNAIHRLIWETQRRVGFTAILVSHDIPDVFPFCDYVAMLHAGSIIDRGTPDEIRRTTNPVLMQFLKGEADGPIRADNGIAK